MPKLAVFLKEMDAPSKLWSELDTENKDDPIDANYDEIIGCAFIGKHKKNEGIKDEELEKGIRMRRNIYEQMPTYPENATKKQIAKLDNDLHEKIVQ